MATTAIVKKQLPGAPAGHTQPQMLVSTIRRRVTQCSSSGWDAVGVAQTEWFPTGALAGTVFLEDNGETFDIDVEVISAPVILANGSIDLATSGTHILGAISAAAGLGGFLNIDVVSSHFRLKYNTGVAPTVAFDAFFWSVLT